MQVWTVRWQRGGHTWNIETSILQPLVDTVTACTANSNLIDSTSTCCLVYLLTGRSLDNTRTYIHTKTHTITHTLTHTHTHIYTNTHTHIALDLSLGSDTRCFWCQKVDVDYGVTNHSSCDEPAFLYDVSVVNRNRKTAFFSCKTVHETKLQT